MVLSFIKQVLRKEQEHDYDIYKKDNPVTPKEVVNVFDLGYLGVEKDLQEQIHHYLTERRETNNKSYLKKKKRVQPKSF